MEFKDYVNGLKPYISNGKSDSDFFVEIIGNFIDDAVMDSCQLLEFKPDTQYRYMKGNPMQKKHVQYVYNHRNPIKYVQWISERIEDSDSYQHVCDWLKKNGLQGEYPENECQELLESILLSICNYSEKQKKPSSPFEDSFNLINDIDKKIEQLPRPTQVSIPNKATNNEELYINELFAAYGDAESIDGFCDTNLKNYPEYKEDLEDRRVDYYAAVSIERGVMELNADNLASQFDILKNETLDGVKDTARKKYLNGYEKMLSVMEHATSLPLNEYLLRKSPYWISGKIKKGVCHHLVNDGKLRWVKKK